MKEFFAQCLEELELKTGIKQVFWLKQETKDQADFDKKIGLLINEMVLASKKFDYIPEEDQKNIITKMMREDQTYDGLNSRVIWKWLEAHKSRYVTASKFSEEELMQHEPLTDQAKIDEYCRIIQENIAKIQDRGYVNGMKPLREKAGYTEGVANKVVREKFIVGKPCPDCGGSGKVTESGPDGDSLVTCYTCDGVKEVNRVEVYATNVEEAYKAYYAR